MKDRKSKKEDLPKEKTDPFKPAKFVKDILQPFSELLSTKTKRMSFTSRPKTPRVNSKARITPCNMMIAVQKNLIRRYSPTNADYNDIIVDNLIYNKNCHMVSTFKDYMIIDYVDEFLKRVYRSTECTDRIPKIANYYKNYLKFFCNPVFRDFKINCIVQSYGDFKAEIYYNNNYGGKNKDKDKDKDRVDDNIRNIFNTTVKENIDRNSLTQSHIQVDNTIFETEMNYKPTMNNFGISHYYADGMNMIEFEDSHSTLSHLVTAKSKEESILGLISSLENKKYLDKKNEKIFKEFENKVIGSKDSKSKEKVKINSVKGKSEKNTVNEVINTKTPESQVHEINHMKHPSLNRPPSSLKLHLGEFRNIKLCKTNNFLQNAKPGHTKNSSSQPSNDLLQTYTTNKQTFTMTFHNNTPIVNKDIKYSNRSNQNESSRLKNKPESRIAAHQNGSIKMNIKSSEKEKRNITNELQGKPFAIPNNIRSINDIMKITLSLCVDKSSRNRPHSNQILSTNSTNNLLASPLTSSISNLNAGDKRTTIINKVGNINNFNININNQINIPENIQQSLLSTLPIQISTKNIPNSKEPLNNLFLEKNKLTSRTRNKESNLYKMPSSSIKTQFEGDKKNGFLRETKENFSDAKIFSSYNNGIYFITYR
jgi:hypothetical protein